MSGGENPVRTLATVSLLVEDYDAAIDWFTSRLGFALKQDVALGTGKRWVVVGPKRGANLLLAKAEGDSQLAAIGNQAGGRVALFLETDDFARDHAAMQEAGIVFRETPRYEEYGAVAVFEDCCGNLWDLIEPRG